ncbi:hypothetical protein [Thermoactinospora rubra]|uniref:hypothetical protein n=1 Tax=Thermoactinospora rubra TaxID=1088767 RepID=UPI000A121EEF|nr:hypothetical protein [Thermoactinospora rubra]
MSIALLMAALAVGFVLPGWLAHTGRWRDWSRAGYALYAPLALLWMGAGGELLCVGTLIADAGAVGLGRVIGAIGLAGIALGTVFLFWTPPPLRPRWLRERKG